MQLLRASGRFRAWAAAGLSLIALASLQPAAARASVAQPWLTTSGTAFVDAEGTPCCSGA